MTSVKRKHDGDDVFAGGACGGGGGALPYPAQRQSVLDISLVKLSDCAAVRRGEPSLRRSVLIFNTLRRIETELVDEGGRPSHPPASPQSILPAIRSGDDLTLDVLTPPPPAAGGGGIVMPWSRAGCGRLRAAAAATADSRVTAADIVVTAPVAIQIDGGAYTALPPLPSAHIDMDVFTDLDMSLFDLDLMSPLTSTVKLTPLSAEELMHTLPPSETFIAAPAPCGGSGGGYPPAPCSYKHELLGDDLDHIMQVLVGI